MMQVIVAPGIKDNERSVKCFIYSERDEPTGDVWNCETRRKQLNWY